MSEKIVVRAVVEGNHVLLTEPDGTQHRQPLTEKVAHKMADLPSAYFYARKNGHGFSIRRFAPVSAWAERAA